MKTTLTLDELKQLCIDYDEYIGCYPENVYEGEAVYEWIIAKLKEKE